eukprot:3765962-Amphidinium_carterae.1
MSMEFESLAKSTLVWNDLISLLCCQFAQRSPCTWLLSHFTFRHPGQGTYQAKSRISQKRLPASGHHACSKVVMWRVLNPCGHEAIEATQPIKYHTTACEMKSGRLFKGELPSTKHN